MRSYEVNNSEHSIANEEAESGYKFWIWGFVFAQKRNKYSRIVQFQKNSADMLFIFVADKMQIKIL